MEKDKLLKIDLNQVEENRSKKFWTPSEVKEWIGILFVGSAAVYAARTTMAVVIVEMSEELRWDKAQSGAVMGSFFWGYLLTNIAGGILGDRLGGEYVMSMGAYGWSVITFCTPLLPRLTNDTHLLMYIFVISRVLLGMCQGMHYPSVMSIVSKRMPDSERSSAYGIQSGGAPLGILLNGFFGAALMNKFGWKCVFYVIGLFAVSWLIVMKLVMLPREKLSKDTHLKNTSTEEPKTPVPWFKLMCQPAVWAIIINHMASSNSYFILLSWMPTYFHDKFPEAQSWVFNVVPWVVNMFMTLFQGFLADYLVRIGFPVLRVRKFCQILSFGGQALGILTISFTRDYITTVCALTFSLAMGCFHHSGALMHIQDIAPNYAGSLFGVINSAGAIPGFLGVYIAGHILETTKSWSSVFNTTAVICFISLLIFLIFARGKRIV